MSYTALKKMQDINYSNYHIYGPQIPAPVDVEAQNTDGLPRNIEKSVLAFLRDRCTDLLFDTTDEARVSLLDRDGSSIRANTIPYNMEKDIDRLCLYNAIDRFMQSGTQQSAFDIYFCYLEMFIGKYSTSKKMIEMLAEFESNASSLLMKHRDHYSHSVYVFCTGITIYQNNKTYRNAYIRNYWTQITGQDTSGKNITDAEIEDDDIQHKAAAHFLRYWGLTSLFHDIGYPFEIPFEEVKSYFDDSCNNVPFVSYRGMHHFDNKGFDAAKRRKLLGSDAAEHAGEEKHALTLNYILAHNVAQHFEPEYKGYERYFSYVRAHSSLKYDAEQESQEDYLARAVQKDPSLSYEEYLVEDVLERKAGSPDAFGGFMDHGFFSALLLLHNLMEVMDADQLNTTYTDCASAILLHNSIYKFIITNYKDKKGFNATHHLRPDVHPLAYLLFLCDELQCWDRVAYGRNSRSQYHPMWGDVVVTDEKITAIYFYDKAEYAAKKSVRKGTFSNMHATGSMEPDVAIAGSRVFPDSVGQKIGQVYFPAASERPWSFTADINGIVNVNDVTPNAIPLVIGYAIVDNRRKRNSYLSSTSFLHLYNLAYAMNSKYAEKYNPDLTGEEAEKQFAGLSLEYKLSNINSAEEFAGYLNDIGCFYTDRETDFDMVDRFSNAELNSLSQHEHSRWLREKREMGWAYGTAYETIPAQNQDILSEQELKSRQQKLRELTRTHKDLTDYGGIQEQEQGKDTNAINAMVELLRKYDGIRIYRLH